MTAAAPQRAWLGDAGPVAVLLALAAGAWALSAGRMAGMDAGPGADRLRGRLPGRLGCGRTPRILGHRGRSLLDSAFLGWEEAGYVAAAVIAAAGLYQLTTAKRAFLRRCARAAPSSPSAGGPAASAPSGWAWSTAASASAAAGL